MNKDFFALYGGYGKQYWTNLMEPNIAGTCNGITVCKADGETGEMSIVASASGIESPGTLVISPDQRFVYAANELNDFMGRGCGGGISAFSFETQTGAIKLINQTSACGSCTAYITLDKTGRYILVANHGSYYYCSRYVRQNDKWEPIAVRDEGSVSLFSVREDGGVGEMLDRIVLEGTGADELIHGSAHPHSVLIDDDDFIVIPNKGGDNIYICKLNRKTQKLDMLSVYKSQVGSSPRHAAFCPGTPFVVVQNEYDAHLCSYYLSRTTGELKEISRIDTCDPEDKSVCAFVKSSRPWGCDVQIHPNGKFVYCNNTQNNISLFALNIDSGELTFVQRFKIDTNDMSRGMQIDRTGRFLVLTCVMDDRVNVYKIDEETGLLTKTSEITLPTPTALRFAYP